MRYAIISSPTVAQVESPASEACVRT